MLIPSARMGISTHRNVMKLTAVRTKTRTIVRRGFEPKIRRRVRLTHPSASGGFQSSRSARADAPFPGRALPWLTARPGLLGRRLEVKVEPAGPADRLRQSLRAASNNAKA